MKKVLGFYRTFFQTLLPSSYEGFAESRTKNSFGYYFSLVLNALIIFAILMIPVIVGLPTTIESKLNNVAIFNMDTNFSTTHPILIPEKYPVAIINYNSETPNQSANIILNNNLLYVGAVFKNYQVNISGYGNVKQKGTEYAAIITTLILLMLPSVAVIAYIFLLVKYFILVIIASILVFILAKILSYRIDFGPIFNSAMYGVSLSVFLDLIFFALNFEFYYIQYLPLLIYTFCGVSAKGEKLDRKQRNKFVEIKQKY